MLGKAVVVVVVVVVVSAWIVVGGTVVVVVCIMVVAGSVVVVVIGTCVVVVVGMVVGSCVVVGATVVVVVVVVVVVGSVVVVVVVVVVSSTGKVECVPIEAGDDAKLPVVVTSFNTFGCSDDVSTWWMKVGPSGVAAGDVEPMWFSPSVNPPVEGGKGATMGSDAAQQEPK